MPDQLDELKAMVRRGWAAFPPGCADCGRLSGADWYISDPVFEDDGRWVCEHCHDAYREIEVAVYGYGP